MRKYAPYLITGAIVAWIATLVLLIAFGPDHGAGAP